MSKVVRVANVQAFWGDYTQAAKELLSQASVDYLTLDYLAEVSMSILAKQMRRDPKLGYARDFVKVVETIAPNWIAGSDVKVVSNAGGLTPQECAERCAEVLREAGCTGRRIGVVAGDSVLPALQAAEGDLPEFRNLDTGESIETRREDLITANAYFGAKPIVQALEAGADLVITGRVADPSMVVGPCVFEHGWQWDHYDRLAGATVAGHLIECGTQVTGGISSHWLELEDPSNIGYPIVEIDSEGGCIVTKPGGTGGRVDERSVKEQLLYELGDPGNYLSPDVAVSFLGLKVKDLGDDRVQVDGAIGAPPPPTLKVSGTYEAGFHGFGCLTIYGRDAVEKAQRAGQLVLDRLKRQGLEPQDSRIECLGAGAVAPMSDERKQQVTELVLRVSVADERREVIQRFASDWVALVCCGPQGTTGYAGGRPRVSQTVAYWPCLIPQEQVPVSVEVFEV